MSTDIKSAIESLYSEMGTINNRLNEIKKSINALSVLIGEEAPFSNAEISSIGYTTNIRPDQFFGKGLATAVKEYLKIRGRASTVQEIYEALKTGGYEFTGSRAENILQRNLAISLSKNSNDFVYVKSSNSYGLWEFYPEKQREKKKPKVTTLKGNSEDESENKEGNP
ncbi:MAG: hypothetical protein A2057_13395 [Ignavibacteria bacterium GWA2_35_9]|nr:MAG: hypothetical protein A2057_13395 [Ignavibacteria bacterium GWA2_35_9]OGU46639.1 MAG: hypothetical protein A2000_10830 [Ignavibacteria bacterium GWB2_36_8]OGU49549.1 MAG: hypothetical protein A2080_02215 [Ignavibacteria bacterium GWC2_36_12]